MGLSRQQRLGLFATTAFVAIFGVAEFAGWVLKGWSGVDWWGIDLHLVIDAGGRWMAGQPIYANPAFLYPPLAAVVGALVTSMNFDVLSVLYALAKIAIAIAAVEWVSGELPRAARGMIALTLVTSLPFLHDVMLGNANVVLVGAIAVSLFGPPRPRSGVLLGLAAALFAKPLVLPILLWLLVWRRPVLIGTVATGLAATAIGVWLAGLPAYFEWVSALAGGTRFASGFAGNHGITAIAPGLWLPVALVTLMGLVYVLLRRGPNTGITWAATSGLLIAPYAGVYSALPIALAIPGLARATPGWALAIAAVSPIATTHPLPLYAAAILLAALLVREPTERA
jgi:hypothetical protein